MNVLRPIKTVEDLERASLVDAAQAASLEAVAARYAIALTPAIAALIDRSDPNDPIARQFVPDQAELVVTPEERVDPIGDAAHSPVAGIVHRYPDRVLLKAVHVCPVYWSLLLPGARWSVRRVSARSMRANSPAPSTISAIIRRSGKLS